MAHNLLNEKYGVIAHIRRRGPAAWSPAGVARQASAVITIVPDTKSGEGDLDYSAIAKIAVGRAGITERGLVR
jgi:hypothetical protein